MTRADQEQRIQRARELDASAPEGPWHHCCAAPTHGHGCGGTMVWDKDADDPLIYSDRPDARRALAFCATMRTLGPALAEDLAAVHREIDELRTEIVEAKAQRNRFEQDGLHWRRQAEENTTVAITARAAEAKLVAEVERLKQQAIERDKQAEDARNAGATGKPYSFESLEWTEVARIAFAEAKSLAAADGTMALIGRQYHAGLLRALAEAVHWMHGNVTLAKKLERTRIRRLEESRERLKQQLEASRASSAGADAERALRWAAQEQRDGLQRQAGTKTVVIRIGDHPELVRRLTLIREELDRMGAEIELWRQVSGCTTPQDLDKQMERALAQKGGADAVEPKSHTTIAPGTTGGELLEKTEEFAGGGAQLSGKIGELPTTRESEQLSSTEEFRPGLPPEALRKAWRAWEDSEGDLALLGLHTYRYDDWPLTSCREYVRFRPAGKTWAEVERMGAEQLGREDAQMSRAPRSAQELVYNLANGNPQNGSRTICLASLLAYERAYAAAKQGAAP